MNNVCPTPSLPLKLKPNVSSSSVNNSGVDGTAKIFAHNSKCDADRKHCHLDAVLSHGPTSNRKCCERRIADRKIGKHFTSVWMRIKGSLEMLLVFIDLKHVLDTDSKIQCRYHDRIHIGDYILGDYVGCDIWLCGAKVY
ncbi:hypothetical protein KIL84_006400 [Mauremys mutica]|uniref:Uncharacterized protein n=1 Tax=Mauremys mutica TaxID=74926 RepID=A0A9D3WZ93_9SAUR|nr:hypothetical protein KIL84_006400 [Mauremys mutica]